MEWDLEVESSTLRRIYGLERILFSTVKLLCGYIMHIYPTTFDHSSDEF